jgi:hypothetical protein
MPDLITDVFGTSGSSISFLKVAGERGRWERGESVVLSLVELEEAFLEVMGLGMARLSSCSLFKLEGRLIY